MSNVSYNVMANLELGAKNAVKGMDTMLKKLQGLKGTIDKVKSGWDASLGSVVALGAAYLSFGAITSGMKALAVSVVESNAQVEGLIASLAVVYSAVEKVSYGDAVKDAKVLFKTMEKVALVSTATTQQLAEVFNGIYGPLRNAGLTIQQIVDTTNNASVAASALGVDFQQATRDISAMARGTAGLDVKTFSLLQSMGLITETTEKWNKLAADKRAKRLVDIMSKFGGQAAEAYGKTWKGLTSTLTDIIGALKRAFGAAVFERMKGVIDRLNTYLLANRAKLETYLHAAGERVGKIFDVVVARSMQAYSFIMSNVARVSDAMHAVFDRIEGYKPFIIKGLKFAGELKLASMALGVMMPAVSLLMTAMSGLVTMIGGIAAAGGISAWVAGLGASLGTFGAAVAAAAGPVAIAAAVIAALVLAVVKFKDTLWAMMQPLIENAKDVGRQLLTVFRDLWTAISPILTTIGGILLMQLIAAFRVAVWVLDKILMPIIRLAARVISWAFVEILQPIFEAMEPVMLTLVDVFGVLVDAISGVLSKVWDSITDTPMSRTMDAMAESTDGGGDGSRMRAINNLLSVMSETQSATNRAREAAIAKRNADEAAAQAAADANEKRILSSTRPSVVNDFRGSKIEIKQEFREADPDNVWVQFREGLEREATARTRSGFADPLAR